MLLMFILMFFKLSPGPWGTRENLWLREELRGQGSERLDGMSGGPAPPSSAVDLDILHRLILGGGEWREVVASATNKERKDKAL